MESRYNSLVEELKKYFSGKEEIAFAFLFGSVAKGNSCLDSDIDIAVYFIPGDGRFDLEDDVSFKSEDEIWSDLERLTGREVDFVVLNRASSTICASVYLEGFPVIIRNQFLYWKHFSITTDLAEEYRSFTEDYIVVKGRSKSLSPIDRNRKA